MAVLIWAAFLLERDMTPIYAIGDIHGHLDKLDEALERIHADGGADASVVFVVMGSSTNLKAGKSP